MDARESTFFGLLDGSKHYLIPHYQRLYSWESKHCERLFHDVVNLARNKSQKHFMGSIVYVSHTAKADGVNEFVVIDGQQRLTTLSLLLLAAIEALKLDDEERRRRINKTLRNGDEPASSSTYLKLKLTRTDNDSYKHLVHSISAAEATQNDDSRIHRNFATLRELLRTSECSPPGNLGCHCRVRHGLHCA